MIEQLARRRETLAAGARHVGWKLGTDDRDSISGAIGVGYITSATRLVSGDAYRIEGLAVDLRADVELALELGRDIDPHAERDDISASIRGYATALEIVDVSPILSDSEAVIAANDFHRAVAFGRFRQALPAETLRATAAVNGADRDTGEAKADVADRLLAAARVLEVVGMRLRRRDRIITGLIVQIPVKAGDSVEAKISGLDSVQLMIAP